VTYADQPAAGTSWMSDIGRAAYAWETNTLGADCTGGTALTSSGESFFAPDPAGTHVLYLCVKDRAGNVGVNSGHYNWDDLAPVLTLNHSSSSIYYDSAQATISTQDSVSGLASIYYRWNDDTNVSSTACGGAGASPLTGFTSGTTSEWTSASPLTPPDYGDNMLYVCVIDQAGNIAASSAPYLYGVANLTLTSLSADSSSGINLAGSAWGSGNNQDLVVFATICNTVGQCIKKEFASFDAPTSASSQNWTLIWPAAELPAGVYSGTIWVNLVTTKNENVVDTLSAQSNPVNFTIASTIRAFPITAFKDQAFSLDVGAASNYDLGVIILPVTNNGVTATNTGGKLTLSSTGLTTATTATFGNTSFVFALQERASGIIEVSFE
jgi:hypothetical protein